MLKDQRVSKLKAALQTQFEEVFRSSALPGDELDQARHRRGIEQAAFGEHGSAIDGQHAWQRIVRAVQQPRVPILALEHAPGAIAALYRGENLGKQLIRLQADA